jgi:hypothetical protein
MCLFMIIDIASFILGIEAFVFIFHAIVNSPDQPNNVFVVVSVSLS